MHLILFAGAAAPRLLGFRLQGWNLGADVLVCRAHAVAIAAQLQGRKTDWADGELLGLVDQFGDATGMEVVHLAATWLLLLPAVEVAVDLILPILAA